MLAFSFGSPASGVCEARVDAEKVDASAIQATILVLQTLALNNRGMMVC